MTTVLDRSGEAPGRKSEEALTVRQAAKTFGGVQVLRGVSLSLRPGELRALVGENGSGKSTFVKLLAGYHEADPGAEFMVAGQQISPHQPGASDEAGLRFVHQDLALVDALSTVENLGLGRGYGSRKGRPVRWARLRDEARAAMLELGYDIDVERPVASLGASERTAVAVARAVSQHHSPPRVLVLDEPTASLPGPEVQRLFALVRRVTASGVAVLFVSHHLTEVFEIADSVTVLRGGDLVTTRLVDGLTEEGLIELMVGRAVPRTGQAAAVADTASVVLAARGLAGDSVLGLDLTVAAGEIVGIAGITGSGREAFAPLLFGARPRSGVVTIDADPLRGGRPDLSVAAGMALIPAERARNASVSGHDIGENISIARPRDFMRRGVFRRRLEAEEVMSWLQRLDVRPLKPRMPLSQLSGGNAQKVILARWLRLKPKVLVLDEPTQGVDVGAKEDIHQRLDEAAAEGCAVVICSTDSEELARLCSRVIVLVRGRAAVQLRAPLHPDDITAASLGATRGTTA